MTENTTDDKTHQHYHLRCLDIELTVGVKGFHQFLLVDKLADHTVSPLKPYIKKLLPLAIQFISSLPECDKSDPVTGENVSLT